jgi:hypothetical protein
VAKGLDPHTKDVSAEAREAINAVIDAQVGMARGSDDQHRALQRNCARQDGDRGTRGGLAGRPRKILTRATDPYVKDADADDRSLDGSLAGADEIAAAWAVSF